MHSKLLLRRHASMARMDNFACLDGRLFKDAHTSSELPGIEALPRHVRVIWEVLEYELKVRTVLGLVVDVKLVRLPVLVLVRLFEERDDVPDKDGPLRRGDGEMLLPGMLPSSDLESVELLFLPSFRFLLPVPLLLALLTFFFVYQYVFDWERCDQRSANMDISKVGFTHCTSDTPKCP